MYSIINLLKIINVCKYNALYLFMFLDDNNDKKSQRVLNELENIDDECDTLGIVFVKIDDEEEAKVYGIEELPALLYFENGVPTLYNGTRYLWIK